MAIMAITTRSSINVNPAGRRPVSPSASRHGRALNPPACLGTRQCAGGIRRAPAKREHARSRPASIAIASCLWQQAASRVAETQFWHMNQGFRRVSYPILSWRCKADSGWRAGGWPGWRGARQNSSGRPKHQSFDSSFLFVAFCRFLRKAGGRIPTEATLSPNPQQTPLCEGFCHAPGWQAGRAGDFSVGALKSQIIACAAERRFIDSVLSVHP